MEYVSAQDIADRWGISKRRVQILCANNRIENAKRIGNMWVVPSDTKKPSDARHKKDIHEKVIHRLNPIKIARVKIKKISEYSYKTLIDSGMSSHEAKITVVSIFALQLLESVTGSKISFTDNSFIFSLFKYEKSISYTLYHKLALMFHHFIKENPFCSDDALSWCYQFVNKCSKESGFDTTQFFTEKYMIMSIVDNANIYQSSGKILDPACGGGNFLLYCFDLLADELIEKEDDDFDIRKKVNLILSRLFGYEIDPVLAKVASINLRIKALSILSSRGVEVQLRDFMSITPNVYYSKVENLVGALDCDREKHGVKIVGEDLYSNLKDVFQDTQYLFTNPPFQTIKGMDQDLKLYLKNYYPTTKCDMCNAFIQLSESVLVSDGRAGMVTQNSWMYLDSYIDFRRNLLNSSTIKSIIELGANAFYDLGGEKANVVLLDFLKRKPDCSTKISLSSLKNLPKNELETILASPSAINQYRIVITQNDVISNNDSRFEFGSSKKLNNILQHSRAYGEYAVPMQGTSTGNAKDLIDYYWNHIGDTDWIPASKGGGYSRWLGLNSYCVKWGTEGEYIKATPGSAIRNASYFKETQLVFSDTGTSGLNVRMLYPNFIFVASGPGIRVTNGDVYAHLAFLNSRIASYFIRALSPKLTIAAGYIAKLPVVDNILSYSKLTNYAKKCVDFKKHRLEKRPTNMEFLGLHIKSNKSIKENAYEWFLEDVSDEWEQLKCEYEIERELIELFGLSEPDLDIIDSLVGSKRVYGLDDEVDSNDIIKIFNSALDTNCSLTRTRSKKNELGCDGVIEFIAQKLESSCEIIYKKSVESDIFTTTLEKKYINLFLHSISLSSIGLLTESTVSINSLMSKIAESMEVSDDDYYTITQWLRQEFSEIHRLSLLNYPIYKYDEKNDTIERIRGSVL